MTVSSPPKPGKLYRCGFGAMVFVFRLKNFTEDWPGGPQGWWRMFGHELFMLVDLKGASRKGKTYSTALIGDEVWVLGKGWEDNVVEMCSK